MLHTLFYCIKYILSLSVYYRVVAGAIAYNRAWREPKRAEDQQVS